MWDTSDPVEGISKLSVAFTKEDSAETASETMLPARPISAELNLVTEAGSQVSLSS